MYFVMKDCRCWSWCCSAISERPPVCRILRGRGFRGNDVRLLLLQPLLELVGLEHRELAAHRAVAEAAQLRAGDLVHPGLRRLDPHVDGEPGDRVLLQPERRHEEAVDDVLRAQPDL